MAGPFPGMDPYLDHSARWPGFHHRLITYVGDTLNRMLPPRYVADFGERLYVVKRSIYPDVAVVKRLTPPASVGVGTVGVAVQVASDPPWVLTLEPAEIREPFIQIVSTEDEGRVITAIEILSPANKAAGSPGRELYLTKQRELLASETHLIEIDLLRRGEHTVAAPRDRIEELGSWQYLVCLHRAGEIERFEVWPIKLRRPLPRIRVPLADGDADVVLDLQSVLDRAYDEGAYARRLDYCTEPPIPLTIEDAAWADQLLRERGLRE